MSGKRQSFLANSLKKMTLTIFLSVHWGAPQEQTSARITEPLCKHHQSLSLVWLILNSKCDHFRESWYSEEELNAHIGSVHKDPTSPGLELKSVESEKTFERGAQLIASLSPWSSFWRRSVLPTLPQLPKLCSICAKKVNFELISAKRKKEEGLKGSKRCEGLHCKRSTNVS